MSENAFRAAAARAGRKVADLIGDVTLVGRAIAGRSVGSRSGHAMNHALARRLVEAIELEAQGEAAGDKHEYTYVTLAGPVAGFRMDVDSAIEDADWKYESNGSTDTGISHQPGDGAGLEVFVNDHGNVTAWIYGRNGHKREIFGVV